MSFRRGYRLVHRSGPRRRNLLYPMCTKDAARALRRCFPLSSHDISIRDNVSRCRRHHRRRGQRTARFP